jgi:membrane fusion protein (multidrug efflux system)
MERNIRWIMIPVVAALLTGCSGRNKINTDDAKREFPITQLVVRDTVLHRDYVGDIHALRNVEIRARAKGYLDHIYVDEGQEVKQGQLLFQINRQEYESELAQTKASLNNFMAEAEATQLEMDRVKILVEKNVLSEGELKLAKTRWASANAKIEEARSAQSNAAIRLSHTSIKAPFDGFISRIPFKMGSLIDEGSLLTTVSDTRFVYAYFEVSENEYLDYVTKLRGKDPGENEAQLILANGTNHKYKGKIETIVGEFEANTGTIAFRAKFPNPDKLLKHGSSGKVRLSREVNNVLIVPQKATFEIQDRTFVYVINEKNEVKMKSFIPRMRFSHFYIVESGLRPGEKIVYEGIQSLREGMKIVPAYFHLDSLLITKVSRKPNRLLIE